MTRIKSDHIALRATNDIQKICSPLVEILGIDGFCYHKILPHGKELLLSNDPNWVSHIFEKNRTFNKELVEICVPGNQMSFGFTLWPIDNTIEILKETREICRWIYGITLSNNQNEYFGFSVKSNTDLSIINHYVNNMELLERFCLFFSEHAKTIITQAQKETTLQNSSCDSKATNKVVKDLKKDFANKTPLKKIPVKNFCLNEVSLTTRELECLRFFMSGATSDDIATLLKISNRTVETHLENIKIKFCVSSKSELLKLIFMNGLDKYIR